MKKKLISMLLILAIATAVLPISASVSAATSLPYSQELFDYIVESLENDILEIDVYDFHLTTSQGSYLSQDLHDRAPQFFYLESGFSYSYSGSRVYTLYFSYEITNKTEREAAIKFVNDELDYIVSTLPEGLDDFEKALYFHDYLCLNYQYDTDYEIYDVYNMLKYGEGVCQAYTGVYDLLLERVGIENTTANTSDHIWNLVLLDGEWYHIDATWGDPVPDYFGSAWHEDFLVSDEVFLESRGSFYSNVTANDTSYDSFSWHSSITPFGFANGKTYMLDNDEIMEVDLHTGSTELLYVIDDQWRLGNYYYGVNSGFGSYKNRLIFNDSKSIISLDPVSGKTQVLETPDIGSGNAIFNMYVTGNTVYYLYGSDFDADQIGSFEIVFEEEPVENPYDVNGDGKFNMFDYLMVKSVYFGKTVPTDEQFVKIDCNGNGKVDMFDYMMVKSAYLNQ